MALHLISAITLDRDYSISTVDSSYASDLNNSSSNADVVTKATNSLLMGWNYNVSISNIIISSHLINSNIDFEYGQNFRVEFDITTDKALKIGIGYYMDGVYVFGFKPTIFAPELSPPALLVNAGSAHVSIDNNSSTLEFNEVKVYYFLQTSDNTTATISNFEISGTDIDNGFDSGRVITYWDDVTNDYVVQREDNPGGALTTIIDGPDLGILTRSQITGVLFSRGPSGDKLEETYGARSEYKFCSGLNLVEFFFSLDCYSFPYVFRFDTENSTSCTVDNIVCDVIFNSNPIITPATNKYSNDGQVILSATSSHEDYVFYPIKYTSKSPYTTQGQYNNLVLSESSYVKTGLSYGTHTFYAVDRYNCWAVIQVSVPVQPSTEYGEKYRLQYYDKFTGKQSIIRILERGYEGVSNDVKGSDEPFTLGKTSGDINNKFDTVKPTFCEFQIVTERNFQYIGLFSQDDRKYKVTYEHDGYFWTGFITPSLYQEPYSPNPVYPISITAIDNLGSLGDFDFVDDSGNTLTGLRSVLSLICMMLRKLDLNINVISAVNRFAEGMDMDDENDPLFQTYINTDAFLDDDGNPLKCDYVMESLLKPFGAFIQQDNSKWLIVETDSQSQSYSYREFDTYGGYLSNGTISRPDVTIVSPTDVLTDALLANRDHTLDIIPAYGKMSITQTLKPVKSIFPISLDRWTKSLESGGNANPYSITDKGYKGISFTNITAKKVGIISPFFKVKTRSDSLKISFDYKNILEPNTAPFYDPVSDRTYGPLNVSNPNYSKIVWRLILRVAGVDLYYSERAGWTKITPIGTSTSTMGIGSAVPGARACVTQTGLSISAGSLIKVRVASNHSKYIRGTVSSYDNTNGNLFFTQYSYEGNLETYSDWEIIIGGDEYIDNYIINTEFKKEFSSFDTELNLPYFPSYTEVQLQLQIYVQGSYFLDFSEESVLKSIPTAVYPVDYKVTGKTNTSDTTIVSYTLRNGIDSESSPTIVRGNDFNQFANAVVWEIDSVTYWNNIVVVNIENAIVEFLPNRETAITEEVISFTNDTNYKENLDITLSSGDIPSTIITDEIYTSVFRLSDGSATKNWTRKLITESKSLQSILLSNVLNQYKKPTWRITGSLLIPNAKYTSIVKQEIPKVDISLTNTEFSNITGWTNFGSGVIWYYPGGDHVLSENLGIGGDNNSQYLRQPVTDFIAGTRIRIDFKLTREDVDTYGNSRTDRFVCVLWDNLTIVQKVVLYDGIQSAGEFVRGVFFNLDRDATHISFRVENIVTDEGVANYFVDYFRAIGVSVIRYYYFNAYSRNDRSNLYGAEMVQILPMISSAEIDVDDSGGGNTGGEVSNYGEFSDDFSADFNISLS